MPADFDLQPFDPGDPAHAAFVYDTFRKSMNVWPWAQLPRAALMDKLKRELSRPGTRVAIATAKRSPEFIAWAAVRGPGVVVFAFTKYAARRMGVGTTVCIELGAEIGARPVGLTFWTPAAARITRDKPEYRLFFDLTEAYDQ